MAYKALVHIDVYQMCFASLHLREDVHTLASVVQAQHDASRGKVVPIFVEEATQQPVGHLDKALIHIVNMRAPQQSGGEPVLPLS